MGAKQSTNSARSQQDGSSGMGGLSNIGNLSTSGIQELPINSTTLSSASVIDRNGDIGQTIDINHYNYEQSLNHLNFTSASGDPSIHLTSADGTDYNNGQSEIFHGTTRMHHPVGGDSMIRLGQVVDPNFANEFAAPTTGTNTESDTWSLHGIKCPVCKNRIIHIDFECHLIMCLTKPRISYNEDVLLDSMGECIICLEELDAGNTIARLPCLCIFHKSCIDKWFEVNRSCPVHRDN